MAKNMKKSSRGCSKITSFIQDPQGGLCHLVSTLGLGVLSKKKNSIFKDIIQIEVDLPPSYLDNVFKYTGFFFLDYP